MKFHFKNLGTIKKTTLDLRPLTVIVGPNNTSKTYLAYCVHGMIRALGVPKAAISSKTIGQRLVFSELLQVVRAYEHAAMVGFTAGLPEFFQDTSGRLFRKTRLNIELNEIEIRNELQSLPLPHDHQVPLESAHSGILTELPLGMTLEDCAWLICVKALRPTLTLPAERNALIITYKMLHARRYRLLRGFSRQLELFNQPDDIRYPAPIEDFFDFLTDVEFETAGPKNGLTSPFGKLANIIEMHIQGGHRTEYRATPLGGRELILDVGNELRIDIYNASSSIKQLAPLLLYLRYRAAPNQVLIIDEPEMNLHPEAQAKLLEALGMLANLGVHVLLTTHSPYFMAHLNNLIAADQKSTARKKRQAKHLYMGDPAAFLSPSDVSAYEMRPEGLVSLADSEYGIRWDTLSDVSAELQRRHFAIVEEPAGRGKAKA